MKNKDTSIFEINLLPVISLLAVLICFLLLSTAWVQLGVVEVKQAIGSSENSTLNQDYSLSVIFHKAKAAVVVKKGNTRLSKKTFNPKSKHSLQRMLKHFQRTKAKHSSLKTAYITPTKLTPYKHIISTIDILRIAKITEVGVNPL